MPMRKNFGHKKFRRNLAGQKYSNPLFAKKNWRQFIIDRFSLFGFGVVLLFLLFVYLLFYSPLLQITTIEIQGTDAETAKVLDEKYVRWQLGQRRFWVFRQSNILLFSTSWLIENIEKEYSFESLTINKKTPHSLHVTIKEKEPELIWTTDNTSFYISEKGIVSSKVNDTQTIEGFKTVFDQSNEVVRPGDMVLPPEKISFIINAINRVSDFTVFEIDSFTIPHRLSSQFSAQTTEGYAIYFDMTKDLSNQIVKLKEVFTDSDRLRNPEEYIDLRIGDRVYIK